MTDTQIPRTEPIRTAGPQDVPTVTSTLAAAFHDDPVFRWCVPDPARRAAILPAVFEGFTLATMAHDEIHVGAAGASTVLWVPPGAANDEMDEAAAAEVGALLGDDAERTLTLMATLDEPHPTADHWYLFFLAVRPEAQGHGHGSALLRSVLDRADRDGVPAYLDATSDENRRLYERHGFEVVGQQSALDSPTLWAMWRDPR